MNKLLTAAFAASLLLNSCDTLLEDSETTNTETFTDEGHNDTASAKTVSLDETVTTTLFPDGDKDFFRISMPEGGLLRIATTGVPSNITASIKTYNYKGNHLNTFTASALGNELTAVENMEPGTGYIEFSANYYYSESQSPISLSFKADLSDTLEGNNTFETAFPVTLGETFSNKIIPKGDVDYFKVIVDKGHLLRVATKDIPSNLRAEMIIYNHKGNILESYKATTYGADLTGTCVIDSGTYYVSINDDYNYSSDSPFNISFTSDDKDTLEYNDSMAAAFPVTLGETYNTKLMPKADIDYFKLDLTEGCLLKVTTNGTPASFRNILTFYDHKGIELERYTATTTGLDFSGYCLVDSGTYYVKIEERYGYGSDTPFSVTFESDPEDPLEYNNDLENATPVVLGESYTTKILPSKDIDYFKLSLDKGHLLRVSTSGIPANIRSVITLYDYRGVQLSSYKPTYTGNEATFVAVVDSGTYYVSVSDYYSYSNETPFSVTFSSDTKDTLEYNNEIERAVPVTLGTPYYTKLLPAGDIDFFSFTLADSATISFKTAGVDANIRPQMKLYKDGIALDTYKPTYSGTDLDVSVDLQPGNYSFSVENYNSTLASDIPFHVILDKK